jgi:solute carrier family 35 protein E1
MAFLLTGPIWLWSEGVDIIGDFLWDGSVDLIQSPNSLDHGPLVLEYIFNGTFHFGQNILAFVLLSMVSPVTYSVASLIKRVFVIIIAIIWFRSPTTRVQAVGIALTFLGLYLYDRSSEKNKADQRARSMTETRREAMLLPLSTKHVLPSMTAPGGGQQAGVGPLPMFESPVGMGDSAAAMAAGHAYTHGSAAAAAFASSSVVADTKKSDDVGGRGGRNRGMSNAAWRPPGTRQEDTWRTGDSPKAAAR